MYKVNAILILIFLLLISTTSCNSSKKGGPVNIPYSNIIQEPLYGSAITLSEKQKEIIDSSQINTIKTVTVIYKDEYSVRIDKENNKLIDNGKYDYTTLIALLEYYKITKMTDSDINNNERLKNESKVSAQKSLTTSSNPQSIHYYSFSDEADLINLTQTLKGLPFVLDVYISYDI